MNGGRLATCLGAVALGWSPWAVAMEPASPAGEVRSTNDATPARAAFEPYTTRTPQISIPPLQLPPLPKVADPFEGAPPLEVVSDTDAGGVASAAPRPQSERPASTEELRDPFSESAADAAWATNLRPHRFDALLELLDPFRERDSSTSSYRALAATQRASDGLRDPFSLDARSVRHLGNWMTDLRNPFDPRARQVRDAVAGCPTARTAPVPERCRQLAETLRDPFNSR